MNKKRDLHILVAEDNQDDQIFIDDVFSQLDKSLTIEFFDNGQELVDHLNDCSGKPDCKTANLIILDLNMPVLDGKETLRIVKNDESFKSIPVVIFTASGNEEDRRECRSLGAEAFYTKKQMYSHYAEDLKSIWRTYVLKQSAGQPRTRKSIKKHPKSYALSSFRRFGTMVRRSKRGCPTSS